MGNMKEFNWLYQGYQQSNDKKPESESFLLSNILKYLAHVKKKNIVWWKSPSGNEKEKPVSRCLEVYASSKEKACILGTELKLIFSLTGQFPYYCPELGKTNGNNHNITIL